MPEMTMRKGNKEKHPQRCIKCLMLSSLPGSDFDQQGVCVWCRSNFPGYIPKGREKLAKVLAENRSKSSAVDCLVGLSGGKDSSYALVELRETFGMRVEAFTYSHEGLTSFAMENAMRVCDMLDVRNHLLSLPEKEHLESFKTFFNAWVKSPTKLAAALTCAACKHLHILGAELALERKIPMVVWSMCPLECAPFLSLKVQTSRERQMQRGGMLSGGLALAGSMVRSIALSKAVFKHFSTCLFGCLAFSPTTRYFKLRYPGIKNIFFFDYCNWDPAEMTERLVKKTGWKLPDKVLIDWHSDCVFNVFKEYMFQKMFGVSYMDAFLSNQIRQGIVCRDEAWDILLRSKGYFAAEMKSALKFVGLDSLEDKLDLTCFEIDRNLR